MLKTLALLTSLFVNQTNADQIWYSQSWVFSGNCDATDQVTKWNLIGLPQIDTWHIVPWLPVPIAIRAVELTKTHGGQTVFWMAGNNIVGDAMIFLGPGENHGRHDFPAGMKMPIPAKAPDDEAKLRYLDLHGACVGIGPVQIYYTVYYTYE